LTTIVSLFVVLNPSFITWLKTIGISVWPVLALPFIAWFVSGWFWNRYSPTRITELTLIQILSAIIAIGLVAYAIQDIITGYNDDERPKLFVDENAPWWDRPMGPNHPLYGHAYMKLIIAGMFGIVGIKFIQEEKDKAKRSKEWDEY